MNYLIDTHILLVYKFLDSAFLNFHISQERNISASKYPGFLLLKLIEYISQR